ncbi:hypothetical protein KAJ89_01320 [Candidatus Parcubacteria bacterium]|nr:hypothetical protein [Candidatus Parcubacteria bacterium]
MNKNNFFNWPLVALLTTMNIILVVVIIEFIVWYQNDLVQWEIGTVYYGHIRYYEICVAVCSIAVLIYGVYKKNKFLKIAGILSLLILIALYFYYEHFIGIYPHINCGPMCI